jgi:hypothetical protein
LRVGVRGKRMFLSQTQSRKIAKVLNLLYSVLAFDVVSVMYCMTDPIFEQ